MPKFPKEDIIGAAAKGHLEEVKAFLKKGADVNLKNDFNDTALIHAAQWGYTDIVRLLLENGASVDAQNKSGRTALIVAAGGRGHKEIVRLLLDHGADINKETTDNDTARSFASARGYTDILKMLDDATQSPQQQAEDQAKARAAAKEADLRRSSSPALKRDMPAPKLLRFPRPKK